jgi:hypothetical protein
MVDRLDQHADRRTCSSVEELIDNPVGQSCSFGIRRLGERLHELDEARTQLMSDVMDRVCKKNHAWADVLDKQWHGIGDWVA